MLCIKFKNYLDGQKPVFEVSHRNKPSRVATVWHLSDRFFIIWTVLAFNSTANRYFYLKSCIGQTAPLGLNRLTILRCLNMTFNSILQKICSKSIWLAKIYSVFKIILKKNVVFFNFRASNHCMNDSWIYQEN